ncbi:MAG: hypothetical protein Q9222_007853 [Ikaeria aurantiellina]
MPSADCITSKIDNTQWTLRKVAIGTAACGLLLNIISTALAATTGHRAQKKMVGVTACAFVPLLLSLLWNIANVTPKLPFWQKNKNGRGVPKTAIIITDLVCFFAFLTLAITNGVTMKYFGGWRYSIGADKSGKPTEEAMCPDCQRKWHRGDARSKDEAEESLLAGGDYDEDADGA